MTLDATQMKVGEIRSILIKEYGYNEEEIESTKGKTALVAMLEKAVAETAGIDDVSFGDEEDTGDFDVENIDTDEEVETPPCIGDYEWNDYVMGHFQGDELIKGNPTVDGMRRIAERLIGEIRTVRTVIVQTPKEENERRATAVVTVEFDGGSSFDGAADVYWGNADKPFRNYPVSLAETKAEGRALKRALRLRKVLAAEELADEVEHDLTPTSTTENVEDGPIKAMQIQYWDLMCGKDRLNINVEKLLEVEGLPTTVKLLTHKNAVHINTLLGEFQRNDKEIPTDLVGYQTNWSN